MCNWCLRRGQADSQVIDFERRKIARHSTGLFVTSARGVHSAEYPPHSGAPFCGDPQQKVSASRINQLPYRQKTPSARRRTARALNAEIAEFCFTVKINSAPIVTSGHGAHLSSRQTRGHATVVVCQFTSFIPHPSLSRHSLPIRPVRISRPLTDHGWPPEMEQPLRPKGSAPWLPAR
jgi:hypothetical protein